MSTSPLGDPGLIQLPLGEEIMMFSSTGACTVTNSLVQKVVDLYQYSSCALQSKGA